MSQRYGKKIRKVFVVLFAVCFMLLLYGCDGSKQAQGVSFREDTVTIEKYETYSLQLLGVEDEDIEWKSKDKSIATVEDGVVCGKKKGKATISAYIDGKEVSCNVIITDNQYVPVLDFGKADGLVIDLNGTYALQPTISYNGNVYTDVEYSYTNGGKVVSVDESGVITASEIGEDVVCVEANWRGNVIEESIVVTVVDADTSIEVSGKTYDIYLNGRNEEFPGQVDLGVSIFDKNVAIEAENASVKYIEVATESDVKGAATVKNGVAYAAELGTTHFVAEYTTKAGVVVRSTTFAINVLENPADKYMVPIEGEEFLFFIEPLSPGNSVEWDEKLKAFHLINTRVEEDDSRGFIFNKQYIENIIKYTNAKSIKFEIKTDGIPSQAGRTGGDIWTGFYPDWWDDENKGRYATSDEWIEIEIFFDDITKDADGNLKAIFLLNSYEGCYVRNICPVLEYTGPFLYMDVEIDTTGGDWKKPIELGFVPNSFEKSINDCDNRVTVKAGKKQRIKLRLDELLVNGEFPGFGMILYGGPEWDAKLKDGYTPDRTTITITNVVVKDGGKTQKINMSNATWKSGQDAGYIDANGSGVAYYDSGATIISNGFCYDGYKVYFGEDGSDKKSTYLYLDMEIDTTAGDWKDVIEVGFFPHSYEGDINNCETRVIVKPGEKNQLKIKVDDYLEEGKLPGFGFVIFGGPEWDAKLSDGYTPDRTTITISNVRVKGAKKQKIDLSTALWTSGKKAGYTNSNASGVAIYSDGVVTITNGFRYDGHKVTFDGLKEDSNASYLCMDMEILTTAGDWKEDVELGFASSSYVGDVNDIETRIRIPAEQKSQIRLKLDEFLVDGELPGFAFVVFGGPAWDAKMEDGYTPNRTTITISNVRIEGAKNETIDLNTSTWVNGTNTGFTNATNSGVASCEDGVVTITNGFRFDGHEVTFGKPEDAEKVTYLCMNMSIDTISGNWTDPIEVAFFAHNYEGSVGDGTLRKVLYADKADATKIRLKLDDFLVDGELPGFGFAILGGPEWNTAISDGVYDRTTVTLSDVRLEGAVNEAIDLNIAEWTKGTAGTGFTFANDSGVVSCSDGVVTITNGFRYDGHEVTFGDPEAAAKVSYLCMDMKIATKSNNWTDPIEVAFFAHNYEGSVGDGTLRKVLFADEEGATSIRLKVDDFLVNGELPGFGFAVLGGPEWNTAISDGVYDRTTITLSNVRLEGAVNKTIDLEESAWAKGTEGTGFTFANSGGIVSCAEGIATFADGYRYDGYEVTFAETVTIEEPTTVEANWFSAMLSRIKKFAADIIK